MKNIIKTIFLLCFIFSFAQKIKEENNSLNKNKINEQPIYTIAISVANPHEVYLNDMPLIKDYSSGSSNVELHINNFILKSGVQMVKIVLLPEEGKTAVDKLGIDHIDIKIYRYPNGLSEMSPDKRTLVKAIDLKEFKEIPIVVKEVTFEAKVPYVLKGCSESVDLSKENQEALKKEVLKTYEYFRYLSKAS